MDFDDTFSAKKRMRGEWDSNNPDKSTRERNSSSDSEKGALLRPDTLPSQPVKSRMPKSKIPANLRDMKKHSDHKPAGGQIVIGTIKAKNPPKKIVTGPLSGKTFVITGELKGSSRDEMTDRLRALGAKVTGSVSSKTTCLIHGERLEDGRHFTSGQKFIKATQLNKLILNEEEIEDMLGTLFGQKSVKEEEPPSPVEVAPKVVGTVPWTDKYRPKSIKELVGNSHAVEKLSNWLADWDQVVLFNQRKDVRPISKGRFDPQYNLNAKAVLLSGSPGVGKTSAARLVGKGLGYHLTEMNASDIRSRKAILGPLKGMSLSTSMTSTGKIIKNLIIMDEVDGMSAGDRGGIGAIIEIIKETTVPIICICNERKNNKLKGLANTCYDIRFNKPNKPQVLKRLSNICAKEDLNLEPNALDFILESTGNDIRQSLNILEIWARTNKTMTMTQAKYTVRSCGKDSISMISNFDAGSKLLTAEKLKGTSYKDKMDLFYIDKDLLPLLVYENYTNAIPFDRTSVRRMTQAIDAISLADTINKKIRSKNEWSLIGAYGQLSCIEPALLTGNGVPFPKFPEWLGRYSSQSKNFRLLKETKNALGGMISGDTESVLNDYIPLIYHLVMNPLKHDKINGAKEAAARLYEYGLSPDFLREHMISLQFGAVTFEQEYRDIPTLTKKALTGYYNMNYTNCIEKNKKKKADKSSERFDAEDEEQLENEEVEESSNEEEDYVIKPKIKKKKK